MCSLFAHDRQFLYILRSAGTYQYLNCRPLERVQGTCYRITIYFIGVRYFSFFQVLRFPRVAPGKMKQRGHMYMPYDDSHNSETFGKGEAVV